VAVEACMWQTVQLNKQESIKKWFGKVQLEGDLDAMRQSCMLEWEEERTHAAETI